MSGADPTKAQRLYDRALGPRAVARRLARGWYRIAPKSAELLRDVLNEEEMHWRHGRTAVVRMSAGAVRFDLCVPGDRPKWQRRYQELAKARSAYEPVMLACLTRLLQRAEAPRFMDLGAFFGYYACYASALLRGESPVFAVESNPAYAAAIMESAGMNGFRHLRVLQAALSDRVESVAIENDTVHRKPTGRASTTTTLDDLCRREEIRPTIVKMDVHGAEGKVILGMPQVLRSVDVVLLEMHRLEWLEAYSPGVRRTEMLDALESAGLTLYYVAGQSRKEPHAFDALLAGSGFLYRRLDRASRDLLLFDRADDEFVFATRRGHIEDLLGPSADASNR